MTDLDGRVAVVTGGGRGIGRAIAHALARAGARVAVAGRSQAPLDQVARETGALALVCDVAQLAEVAQLHARVRAELGDADILVANSGITHSTPFTKETLEGWNQVLAVNLTGTFLAARAFLPAMLARGRGRIVCVASTAARVGFKYTAAYCASKHGVLGLVRSLALEVADRGVTVNAVCPGWTETDMVRSAADKIAEKTGRSRADAAQVLAEMSPQRRLMSADEVAALVRFLCSDEAAGVTGQAWNVDGGQVMA
ncbi:MAG TPA: SDR family NAD(P)-dependent oxidoreductase [Polyangia bacterium]|nr:SDR family NAD(P)-dependent oxidoreductase [Polyangia bacterium]